MAEKKQNFRFPYISVVQICLCCCNFTSNFSSASTLASFFLMDNGDGCCIVGLVVKLFGKLCEPAFLQPNNNSNKNKMKI